MLCLLLRVWVSFFLTGLQDFKADRTGFKYKNENKDKIQNLFYHEGHEEHEEKIKEIKSKNKTKSKKTKYKI